MTENEKNLRDLEEWFKMNPTEGAAYAFQKQLLEEEMAREAGQAQAATGGTTPPPDTAAENKRREEESATPEPQSPKAGEATVILTAFNEIRKLAVIREVIAITGLGLKEAKDLVESLPKPIKTNISREEAENIKKAIIEKGGTVEIR